MQVTFWGTRGSIATPGPGTTRTSREDVFYPHFHPGGVHPRGGGPGHVFFGKRGQGYDE